MRLIIVTPNGLLYDGETEYIVVDGNDGQLGILFDHVPVVVPVREGFVKRVQNNQEYFYYVSGGILEFSNDVASVIAQEAAAGETLAIAKKCFEDIRHQQKEENRRKLMDFTQMEKELAQNLKEIRASKL